MGNLGNEDAIPATRKVLRRVSEAVDVPVTVLSKEAAHFNNSALNQLNNLLEAVASELGC